MSARVSLSRRTAETLLKWLGEQDFFAPRVAEELRRALQSGFKSGKKAAQQKRLLKRESKRDATARIRRFVVDRAEGRCECCGVHLSEFDPGEMDHFWSKGRTPQAIETCWLLSRICHRLKTANDPNATHWLAKFSRHAERNGYRPQMDRADAQIAAYELAAASAEAGKAVRP